MGRAADAMQVAKRKREALKLASSSKQSKSSNGEALNARPETCLARVDPPKHSRVEKGKGRSTSPRRLPSDGSSELAGHPTPTPSLSAHTSSLHHTSSRERRDRKTLRSESEMSQPLEFPPIAPPLSQYRLKNNRTLKDETIKVDPGLVYSDSVDMPGVAARLIYSTILPRDEEKYFGDPEETMNLAEQELVKGLQRASVAFGMARSYRKQMNEENRCHLRAREILDENKQSFEELRLNMHSLQKEIDSAISELDISRKTCDDFKAANERLMTENTELQEKISTEQLAHAKEISSFKKEIEELKAENQKLQERIFTENTACTQKIEEKRLSIISTAVREYRESHECYERKAAYSAGFTKVGFYLARAWLEKQRQEEQFPELLWSSEVEEFSPPDWRVYAPQDVDPDEFLGSGLYDELDNLTGPWKFFGAHGLDSNEPTGQISALEELDEGIAPGSEDHFPTSSSAIPPAEVLEV